MVKHLVMDVDGSLTDGKIYIGPNGEAMKAFSVKDGYAILFILTSANIEPIIITSRNSSIVQNRCDELGIKEVHQGKLEKTTTLREIVGEENIGSCAYFGDDLNDMECMLSIKNAGGIVGCPSDAVQEIKAIADYVCINKGGEGALREFAEWLVSPKIDSDEVVKKVNDAVSYLKGLFVSEVDVGKKQIVDDNFFYYVQSYQTKPESECNLESHRKYVEIQMIISGEEAMDIADVSRLTVKEKYDEEKDVMFWKVPQIMARTTLKTGDCIVLYPENAHRGAITEYETCQVLKIVGKVEILHKNYI